MANTERVIYMKEEAFSIWTEWASRYAIDTPERKLLESVRNNRWLVNVTHHDFKNPDALWSFLFEGVSDVPEIQR